MKVRGGAIIPHDSISVRWQAVSPTDKVGHERTDDFAFLNACRVRGAVEYRIWPTDGRR
jgi:hypothetical protein